MILFDDTSVSTEDFPLRRSQAIRDISLLENLMK